MVQMRESVINLILSLTYVHPNTTNYSLKDAADVALEALAKLSKQGPRLCIHL